MNISDYITQIEFDIHSFSIVASYRLNIDRKTEEIAYISGKLDFIDGSILDYKEFLECTEVGIEKYKYGYNYRVGPDVQFRYDNAPDPRARRLESFPDHKHIKDADILESMQMKLSDVLEEIEEIIISKWSK